MCMCTVMPFLMYFSLLVMSRRRSWLWSAVLSLPSSWLLPLGAYLPEEGEPSGEGQACCHLTWQTYILGVCPLCVTFNKQLIGALCCKFPNEKRHSWWGLWRGDVMAPQRWKIGDACWDSICEGRGSNRKWKGKIIYYTAWCSWPGYHLSCRVRNFSQNCTSLF